LRLSVAMLNEVKGQNLHCNDEQDSEKMGDMRVEWGFRTGTLGLQS